MKRGPKIAVAILVLYASAIGVVVALIGRSRDATEAEVKRLANLGDNASSDLRSLPIDLPPLRDTCQGMLESGAPETLLSYAAPYPVDLDEATATDDVTQPHVYLPRRRFEGMSKYGLDSERPDDPGYESFVSTVSDVTFEAPWGWGEVIERRGHRSLRVDRARYLVVSVVRGVVPPRLIGEKRFIGGSAIFIARVLDTKSGDTLCEGSLETEIAPSVVAREASYGSRAVDAVTLSMIASPAALESAFTRALESAPLAAVCATGGQATCEATARAVAPDKGSGIDR